MLKYITTSRFQTVALLTTVVIFLRFLMLNIPNAAPIAAVAIFSGAYIMNKGLSVLTPILILFLSDVVMQMTYLSGMQPYPGFYGMMPAVYGAFAVMTFFGRWLKENKGWLPVMVSALGASLFFFFVTNTVAWYGNPAFPQNMTGLMTNYTLALPFFQNSIISNLFFTGILFGIMETYVVKRELANELAQN